jgi:menaquinone reductase, molybdopterin-binding-like subunit
MSFHVSRRGFLRFGAGGALGLATSGVTLRGLSELNVALSEEEVRVPHGPEEWKPSICSLCPAGCGLRVRMIGDRAVKIQGNPLHPVNQGGLCPKGLAALQELYHPDRLRSPMQNDGTRTAPRWREISWDEAMARLVSELTKLRAGGQAHTVALLDRPGNSRRSALLRRFLEAYGSPNYLAPSSGTDALQAAVFLQQGVRQPVAYDLANTRYVLSFGVNLLEGWGSPVTLMKAFGRWRDAAPGSGAKFVQVEPRLSPTAAKADEWVALRPGTEATLALGIAYVLIAEGLFDADFVRDRTFGFDDWRDDAGRTHLGFRSMVRNEYRLNHVAEVTGVPAETILRIGREFSQNRPAIAIGDHQTSTLPGHPYAAMAVHSLNALVGSIDVPGGVLLQPYVTADPPSPAASAGDWPRIDAAPDLAVGEHHLGRLPEAILSGQPYPIQALLLHQANPVFSEANGADFSRAFEQVPFIASWTAFVDESSAMGDLLLPIATGLERWQDAGSPTAFPHALQGIAPPVLPPRYGSRDSTDVFLSLAAALGGPVAAALPFSTFEQYLRAGVERLFARQSGAIFSSNVEQAWYRLLESSGWWAATYRSADELWAQMREHGGWWEPTYDYGEWSRVCQTPSRRFEFYSQALARWAELHPELARAAGRPAQDDHLFLPGQPALPDPPPEYPLLLMPVEVLPLAGGEGAALPYLQQIAGEHLFAKWDSWLEINPETAALLGIGDGQRVWIESPRGRAQVRARLYAGVHPGVVHLPLGYGRRVGSEWACRGVNPLELVAAVEEPIAGLPQVWGTFVNVYRV